MTAKERLLKKREITPDGCWAFTGYKNKDTGYGEFFYRGHNRGAHAVSYQLFIGEPTGIVCHKPECTRKDCFNPDHLYDGSYKSNFDDAVRSGNLDRTRRKGGGQKWLSQRLK